MGQTFKTEEEVCEDCVHHPVCLEISFRMINLVQKHGKSYWCSFRLGLDEIDGDYTRREREWRQKDKVEMEKIDKND